MDEYIVLEVEMSEVGVCEQHSSVTETTQSNYSNTYFTFRRFDKKEMECLQELEVFILVRMKSTS